LPVEAAVAVEAEAELCAATTAAGAMFKVALGKRMDAAEALVVTGAGVAVTALGAVRVIENAGAEAADGAEGAEAEEADAGGGGKSARNGSVRSCAVLELALELDAESETI
jgi:hypothetical protein